MGKQPGRKKSPPGRKRAATPPPSAQAKNVYEQPGRRGTKPITVHFPKAVRDQLKILAVEQTTTVHRLIAEALNDLFGKYNKPRIAPLDEE